MRNTRDLAMRLRDTLKAPVVTMQELHMRYHFGWTDILKILFFALIVVGLYTVVFSFQTPILDFLGGDMHRDREWLTALCVGLFVPIVAFSYGRVTSLILKLAGFD
jgi:hypothetical protein